ncbi:KAT8 regulatory NSL complex subunit 3 isoform X2 [Anoplophora glabripennis]|uniref:KAT8 regulatory NSL complex subunit 3 isoform X2 n=1 Tax=Anoplophora glabripennis TaxID=217634 RepID=UPI000873E23E|nr:KAT8 regulatory NSL complex subunit 3 isoform X2 [Anoplophora glabripennis]
MSEEIIDVENDIKSITEECEQNLQNSPLELIKGCNAMSLTTEEQQQIFDFALPAKSTINKHIVVDDVSKYTYPTQMTNPYERENWIVSTDHCYARPWNWRPETSFLRPTKTLFVSKPISGRRKRSNPLAPIQDIEDVVDVETVVELPPPIYDVTKVKNLMEECENYASSARVDDVDEYWEDKISRNNWNPAQNRIFNGIVNILNSFNLSKLAYTGVHNEPLLRRTVIDKAVQRVRRLLVTISWDPKIVQWLHQVLIDNLESSYLAAYLDILQTLKSKLPAFVEKMMFAPNSSLRVGALNNANLHPLLERPWDPVASSLVQDKPKKLPGNPVIILVPAAPIMSKRINKWIKLFSHLGTVVTIPTNFGSAAHRMTLTNCVDQMFSITRGKIQDLKADYPGRHIILLGFNAGGTLALQIAQVEPVLCVVSLGFSLLTAEGRRGEPDDNLLELQCPVLFVIGQCSSTSLQEDVEDLRERMRVETGLIVVGSADEHLRINKKKKKSEGITQSIVDRYIVDEVGEFVSGIILSPFPPQIRQSPTHAASDMVTKKSKIERKRYNSNTSSLDSEPPSPTPRISRPVGRPPGSKTKSRLEMKWAQQIAQARMQAYGFNRSVTQNSSLSTLLQGGIKTIPPSQPKPSPSGIKVLENVTLNSSTTAKLISNNGRTIDLSKITVINSVKGSNTAVGNVLLLPDGKLKTVHSSSTKGSGGAPILLPLSPQRGPTKVNRGKYITAKRQLLTTKPPRPLKKPIYVPTSTVPSTLPPPTNLTTQDIMDLPIIFADDNQILDTTLPTDLTGNVSNSGTPKIITSQTSGKFMLVNKQTGSSGNFIITPSGVKKPSPISFGKQPPKYTKIILSSKRSNVEELKSNTQIHTLSPEITVKKVPSCERVTEKVHSSSLMELIDLENEIEATAVPKPNLSTSDIKNITVLPKSSGDNFVLNTEDLKRSSSVVDITDEGDPDYIPPKNLKLE